MKISSKEILADLRSAAWLESELHPELDRHRRHEMADICEGPNIDRVWRVLAVADAECRLAIRRILRNSQKIVPDNTLRRPECLHFHIHHNLPVSFRSFIKEKIHEYLVACVMADRMAVIIPKSSSVWELRSKNALSALSQAAANARIDGDSIRRPLWPL